MEICCWLYFVQLPAVFPSNLHLIFVVVVGVAVVFVFDVVGGGGVFIFHEKVHLLKFNISAKTAFLIAPQMFSTENIKLWGCGLHWGGLQLWGLESWHSQIKIAMKFETVTREYVSVFINVQLWLLRA